MSGFEALGRDVAAAADSEGDQAVATSIKALWVWAGFDAGTNPNHLWEVEYEKAEDGFSVVARVLDKDVWAPEPVVSPPASAAELERSGVVEEVPADEAPAPEVVPAESATATNSDVSVTVTSAPDGTTVTPTPEVAPEPVPVDAPVAPVPDPAPDAPASQ